MSYQYRVSGKKPVGAFRRVFAIKPGDFIKFPLGRDIYQVVSVLPGFRFQITSKNAYGQKRIFNLSAMKRLQVVPRF